MSGLNINPCGIPSHSLCSQKDLENLKAEVQRRQQLQESGKSVEDLTVDSPLELEDKIPMDVNVD